MQLDGKIALVTGAGRGIGRAVAELLAREGATVILVARTEAELAATVAAIRDAGGQARAIPGDLTQDAFVEHLFAAIRQEFGRLDILVNSAGMAPFGPVEELPVQKFRECLELNVVAVFACMQQAIRLMKETGGRGKILNIGSVRSHWSEGGDGGAYNASKYGLRGLTESVARQLHGSGLEIAVGMVCPGVVDTPLTNPGREPRPEWLRPEMVAEAVLHALTAPPGVNVYDTTLFAMFQKPW
ncbi:MAG: SDR family oxidoreductase [Armatimonadetes bacterium]|jgi:NAD(P)-dependent dehydrogenase (short-subunit alcohol dehydrogenase family)|nr:SDR family oxidoreductase [Armatimonadota bacterium]